MYVSAEPALSEVEGSTFARLASEAFLSSLRSHSTQLKMTCLQPSPYTISVEMGASRHWAGSRRVEFQRLL
jgi:hypothetical protein